MAEYFFGITDKGKHRQNNEDTFIVENLGGKGLVLACVIDGVGGYDGGEVAAEIARAVILEHVKNIPGDIIETLTQAIVAANTMILEEKKKNDKNDQMACVLTCAVTDIKNNKFYYAHVGDTRLYLLRDRSLVKVSKDHSVVGFLEETGRLTEEDAMRHPRRNEINKALGFEENINSMNDFIETGESPFLPGDIIFLCSDGLSDMISSNAISSILVNDKSIAEKTRELVDAANEAGGEDNITAVLVQNNKQQSPRVALKPSGRKKDNSKSPLYVSKPLPGKTAAKPRKKYRAMLTFIALIVLSILAIVLFQNNTRLGANKAGIENKKPGINKDSPGSLMAGLNDSIKAYTLHQNENISQPIMITKDSFLVTGNGNTISCDSAYKGPAFIISKDAKRIVLDSLVFKNFDIGIVVQKNNIVFKNVRFINCRVPVQYQLAFSDSVVNGRLKDSIFIPVSTHKSS